MYTGIVGQGVAHQQLNLIGLQDNPFKGPAWPMGDPTRTSIGIRESGVVPAMALSHVQTSVKPLYPQLARSSSERAAFKTRSLELACSVSSSSGWRPNKCRGGEHKSKFARVASRQCCSLRNGFLTDTGILCPRRCPSLSVSRAFTKAARAMAGPYTTTAARLEEAAKQVVSQHLCCHSASPTYTACRSTVV